MFGKFRKLIGADSGSIIPMIALASFAVTGLVGVGVDSGRAYIVQSRLSTALDAAGLAAGSTVNTNNIQTEAKKYMDANYPDGFADSHITSLTATANADKTVITLKATADVPTVFMGMFGHDKMTVAVTSEVTRTSKGMELALVMDTTGSMAGSKLDGAKEAAHDLLDILYGDRDTVDNLWVGLVPFAQAVNIGTNHQDWLNSAQYNTLAWSPTSWGGCVQSRLYADGRDATDDTPADEKFNAYYWPDDNNNDWVRVTAVPNYQTQCVTKYCGSGRHRTECGQTCSQVIVSYTNVTNYVIDSNHGPNLYCSKPITPLTAHKSTVDTAIDGLVADGNTHISEGAAWGWRLLSPEWRGLWGGEMDTNSLPLAYNTPLMNKVMVLMTDGDNTITNSSKGSYGYLSEGKLGGTTNSSTAVSRLNSRLTTVCNSMKANNIIIYTIAFGTDVSSASQTMLKNCATQPDFFFYSPTNDDLKNSFKIIGDSLANLRISH